MDVHFSQSVIGPLFFSTVTALFTNPCSHWIVLLQVIQNNVALVQAKLKWFCVLKYHPGSEKTEKKEMHLFLHSFIHLYLFLLKSSLILYIVLSYVRPAHLDILLCSKKKKSIVRKYNSYTLSNVAFALSRHTITSKYVFKSGLHL